MYLLDKYDSIIDSMNPITKYEAYVESITDPAIQSKMNENSKKSEESQGILASFFSKILKLVTNLIQGITNFVSLTFMSKEERRRYEELKRIHKDDPRFKGKTITVYDFRRLEKEYDELEKRLYEKSQRIKRGIAEPIGDLLNDVKELTTRNLKGITAVVAPSVAMTYASSNLEQAKQLENSLKRDKSIIKELEVQLGTREAKKFERQVHHAANRDVSLISKVYMGLYELKHGKARTLEECHNNIVDQLSTLIGWKGSKLDRGIVALRNSDMIGRAMSNDAVRDTAVTATKAYVKGKKKASDENFELKKKQFLGGKDRQYGTGIYSSKEEWRRGNK